MDRAEALQAPHSPEKNNTMASLLLLQQLQAQSVELWNYAPLIGLAVLFVTCAGLALFVRSVKDSQ